MKLHIMTITYFIMPVRWKLRVVDLLYLMTFKSMSSIMHFTQRFCRLKCCRFYFAVFSEDLIVLRLVCF